ncbi:glycoside hydrolase superfamily [Cunninghamella echinulata]|nr:glycoside hydrolase superfamily [Cunninghamella echinulata]
MVGLVLFILKVNIGLFSTEDNISSTKPKNPHHSNPPINYTYEKDSRLTRSFWGIDYTPLGAQYEYGCNVTQADVIEDLKLLHQLTPRLRLYGMDCEQAFLVLNGMKLMNIDMGVILTIWVNDNATTYERQYNAFWDVIDRFGVDHITGVSVGNEAIFRKEITEKELIHHIHDVKNKMQQRGYHHIPVFTTDIRSLSQLMPEEDQVLDNVHPFFAGTTIKDASQWTMNYFKNVMYNPIMKLVQKNNLTNQPPGIISEIGWPTAPESRSYQASIPSLTNLQYLLFDFICQANQLGIPYYWFEFKDAPWKNVSFHEPREAFWGLFDQSRKLKLDRLPNCPLPAFQKGDLFVPQPNYYH